MLELIRVTSANEDFRLLIGLLDEHLHGRYAAQQSKYDQYNVVAALDTVVVAKVEGKSVGCGCFKRFDANTVEIKRMFVREENRGVGIATRILAELEGWAAGLGFSKAILETGIKQAEAIGLYQKCGYARIENFGEYAGMETSVCFAKKLKGI